MLMANGNECPCEICRRKLDFELDEFLLREVSSGGAVILREQERAPRSEERLRIAYTLNWPQN